MIQNQNQGLDQSQSQNLNSRIFRIAFPSILGFLGVILFETIDIFWIGKLGGKEVAGVGAAAFLEWTLYALMNLTCIGCCTLVSHSIGAKNIPNAHRIVVGSFWPTLIISLPLMIIYYVLSPVAFELMGLDFVTSQFASTYLKILIFGIPILYIFNLQGFVFNAHGATFTASLTLLVAVGINIILDPILIFGWFGFPALGIAGAPVATLTGQVVGIITRIYFQRKKNYIGPLFDFLKINLSYTKELLRIGIPASTTNLIWTMVFPLLTVIITRFGTGPLAGLNIANRIEGFPYFFSVGLSVAIATLVGQAYGSGEKELIKAIVKRGILFVTVLLLPISLAFIFIPETLVGILSDDPVIIAHSSEYLRIVGYFEIFLGWEVLMEGGFNGLGNTRPYMLIRIPLTLGRVPLAWFLAITCNMGISGVWWAITITTLLKGILLPWSFAINKTNKQLLASTTNYPEGALATEGSR